MRKQRGVQMETQIVVEEVGSQTQVSGNLPEKKFRAGAISATIWLNKGQNAQGEPTEYRTISIERNYTDKDGKWHSNNSLRVNDLPKGQLVLQKAYEYLVFKEQFGGA
jgi:hypothetical protein